jgi:putative tricarboxylic transport membrane protein
VVYDSVRLGARWAEDGPQAGYFPFYIGLLVCLSAVINFAVALFNRRDAERDFVELDKLRLVLAVLIPSAIYVAAISWTGIYVSSALFIAFFMRWLGKYPWWKVAAVSIGTMVVFFLIFESWFKVPLPKGPLENLLGVG